MAVRGSRFQVPCYWPVMTLVADNSLAVSVDVLLVHGQCRFGFLFSYFQSAWVFCRNLVIVKVDVMAAITALFPTNVEVVRIVAVCVSAAAPA